MLGQLRESIFWVLEYHVNSTGPSPKNRFFFDNLDARMEVLDSLGIGIVSFAENAEGSPFDMLRT